MRGTQSAAGGSGGAAASAAGGGRLHWTRVASQTPALLSQMKGCAARSAASADGLCVGQIAPEDCPAPRSRRPQQIMFALRWLRRGGPFDESCWPCSNCACTARGRAQKSARCYGEKWARKLLGTLEPCYHHFPGPSKEPSTFPKGSPCCPSCCPSQHVRSKMQSEELNLKRTWHMTHVALVDIDGRISRKHLQTALNACPLTRHQSLH